MSKDKFDYFIKGEKNNYEVIIMSVEDILKIVKECTVLEK